MPNAIVATITTPSSRRKRVLVRVRRCSASSPAWYGDARRRPGRAARPRSRSTLLPGQAVDDAGLARRARAQKPQQLRARIVLVDDRVADVRPVEARHEDAARGSSASRLGDLARASAGRRWRSARCAAPRESARAAPTAAGTRAGNRAPTARRSAPRRSRTARSWRAAEQLEAARREQPLGRDVEQVELAGQQAPLDGAATRLRVERRVEAAARTPACRSAATWSCISAISGETTMPVPSRSSAGSW